MFLIISIEVIVDVQNGYPGDIILSSQTSVTAAAAVAAHSAAAVAFFGWTDATDPDTVAVFVDKNPRILMSAIDQRLLRVARSSAIQLKLTFSSWICLLSDLSSRFFVM